jgi:hypothetical protein
MTHAQLRKLSQSCLRQYGTIPLATDNAAPRPSAFAKIASALSTSLSLEQFDYRPLRV